MVLSTATPCPSPATDCGTQEDPCEDLVCTPIVLDENGHWEIQSNNVDAPDIIDYDYASTGEVCFSITLEEPMALEMNTFFPTQSLTRTPTSTPSTCPAMKSMTKPPTTSAGMMVHRLKTG